MEPEPVQPALRIDERLAHVPPGKGLIARRIAVGRELRVDRSALLVSQELGSFGVVVDEEVGSGGDDYGQEAFLRAGQWIEQAPKEPTIQE